LRDAWPCCRFVGWWKNAVDQGIARELPAHVSQPFGRYRRNFLGIALGRSSKNARSRLCYGIPECKCASRLGARFG
jgi:hypothetical protein